MKRKLSKLTIILFLPLFFGGCLGGSKTIPIQYYLIDPVEFPADSLQPVRELSIEIIDLHLPQYLERFHIATRVSDNRLEFSETHQWGESLRKNLLRTLGRNLSRLLSTIDIGTPLNRSASSPDYRAQVYIDQFEMDSDGMVVLIARWQVSKNNESEPVGVFKAELQTDKPVENKDYDSMVAAMRDLYGKLCKQIAESIVQQET